MKNLHELTKFHKNSGGGAAGPAAQTIASSPPPPTTQSVEVQQAQREAAKQAAKKRGMSQTILAGETGGYKAPSSGPTLLSGAQTPGKSTVLGGI